jgi:hypothetical protein
MAANATGLTTEKEAFRRAPAKRIIINRLKINATLADHPDAREHSSELAWPNDVLRL